MDALNDRLRVFLEQELLGVTGSDRVADEEELLLSGLVDSLGVVRLVAFIEDDLGRPVPPEDVTLEHFQSIAAMVRYLEGEQRP